MSEIYLFSLILICVGLLFWGIVQIERIYQYPFFMGGIFVSFIMPQAIALFNNPEPLNEKAISRVLLMSCLCAIMIWIGYQMSPSKLLIKKLNFLLYDKKILESGIVFVLIGGLASFLISQLPEVVRNNTNWTGIVTIYHFFRSLIYPGFMIIFMSTIRRPSFVRIILTALASSIPIQLIIFEGRREITATFILTVGMSLYYVKKTVPPRWLALTAIVMALLIIPLTSSYRSIAKTGEWDQIYNLKPIEIFTNYVNKGDILELKNAAIIMDASVKTGQYNYGIDYWNNLVFRFIPAQIIGKSNKNALQIEVKKHDLNLLYSYRFHGGSTTTGIGDAFVQFDYFGCLFFFFLGWLFKSLWILSVNYNSMIGQLFYISLIAPAMLSVTHGTIRFFPDFLFRIIFIGAAVIYAKKSAKSILATHSHNG